MTFKWSHFLVVAEALYQDASSSSANEAIYRIVISRAYYAAFCTVRNYLRDKGELIPSDKADVHSEIIAWLRDASDVERQKLGTALKRLRDDRNSADYDDELNGIPQNVAAHAIKSAKNIIRWTSSQ
jgi:uncharacterized protein (UPF0332 family)